MTRYIFTALLAVLTLNTGCNLIYKQNVQQGNALEQDDLDKVELGMTKKQVAYLLGTPSIHDPFHKDRWDYISLLSRRGNRPVRRLVTLTFKHNVLTATNGIGNSKGGDIKALNETRSAVAGIGNTTTAKKTHLVTEDATINWTLQLGAFSTRDEALELADHAREKGYKVKMREHVVPGLGTRHQVRSGLFDTFNEAHAMLQKVEKDLDVVAITVPVDTVPEEKDVTP